MRSESVMATTQVSRSGRAVETASVKIVSKRRNPALTWKIIPDERHAPEGSHSIGSARPLFSAALVVSERSRHLYLIRLVRLR